MRCSVSQLPQRCQALRLQQGDLRGACHAFIVHGGAAQVQLGQSRESSEVLQTRGRGAAALTEPHSEWRAQRAWSGARTPRS